MRRVEARGHHRSLYIIRNFGPRCRTGGPPRLFRASPRNHAYENDLPGSSGRCGSFRLKFGWPVVLHRNLDHRRRQPTKFGCSQPMVVDRKHVIDVR